jgi:prepilin-type N-terminal cleavage/methylation domain-containing protein
MASRIILGTTLRVVYKRCSEAFTLVEMMIVVAIVGLLAAIAVPAGVRAGQTSRNARFASDMQVACGAFMQYSADNGKYPPDTLPAVMPNGMSDYLHRFPWDKETVIGGLWDWDNGQFGVKAGVSVYQPTISTEQLQRLDAQIDDGDLSTGTFRARAQGYISIIEE